MTVELIPRGSLVVSAQARPNNPLHGARMMAVMARAAAQGGASAIRANGPEDVAAIKAAVALPVIGLWKRFDPRFAVAITPDYASAAALAAAGADIIALDATARVRDGEPPAALIARIRGELGRPVFADVATCAEGIAAARAGAAYVATTLSGYTEETRKRAAAGPDFDLVQALVAALDVPVVAEGRFWTPEDVAHALALGAHAVVVGTAITNPREITRRFVAATAS